MSWAGSSWTNEEDVICYCCGESLKGVPAKIPLDAPPPPFREDATYLKCPKCGWVWFGEAWMPEKEQAKKHLDHLRWKRGELKESFDD